MSIPSKTTVLVIGGGPAGSYAASVLGREGVDVTVLEADKFPRYHIGESMIASVRFFFRYIDLEKTFDEAGFTKKFGATFKINQKREAYTDFSASLGPGGHAWNVVRSQADDLIFKHAAKCGAHTFDEVKVNEVEWVPYTESDFPTGIHDRVANEGRPVSATWSKKDGSSGKIEFDYLVDASGRAGVVSTKYLKNRKLNEGLKNIANWAYFKNATRYGTGTQQENSPFFEALQDGSGWCWSIPLHNGTTSIGVVMRQDLFFGKKKALGSPASADLYRECLKLAPQIEGLLKNAEMASDIKQASDWSYSASAYAGPHYRLAGDAGCFIDPYFSSGMHLAFASGLAAAVTIQAARKGEAREVEAAKWHSSKVTEGYTRFLLIVMSVLRQVRNQADQILAGKEESGFEKAFGFIQPIIQGSADSGDATNKTHGKAAEGVGFALASFKATPSQEKEVLDKVQNAGHNAEELEKLTQEELMVLNNLVSRQLKLTYTEKHLSNIANDVIDGLTPKMERGDLGLRRVEEHVNGGVNGFKDGVNGEEVAEQEMGGERKELFDLNRSLIEA